VFSGIREQQNCNDTPVRGAHPSARMLRTMRPSVKQVWFLAAPGTGLLNIGGPWEVLGHANDVLGRTGHELTLLGPSAPAVPT
jgi:hypothetical protein